MKVLIVGDSPSLKTGFGRVNAKAAEAFTNKGWEVASLGGLTDKTTSISDKYGKTYIPSGEYGDVWGFRDVPKVLDDFKPDVIYTTADPGSFVTATAVIPEGNTLVGYLPIEGEPIGNTDWRRILAQVPFITCSDYGTKVVKHDLGIDVDYVYHGIDHEVFNPEYRLNGFRDDIRKRLGLENKFVITCVSTNVRRKQLPRLIEAVSILAHRYKQKDVVLYLHTVPFQHYWLDGWNLPEVSALYGVEDRVIFHPGMKEFNAAVPEKSGDPSYPGLVEMYAASDLFVLPSQVEGFGLPIAEAMACGTPVMVTKYAAGWEVASPAGKPIPVKDWEIHKSATKYANIDPEALASEILKLKRNPKELARMSAVGLVRAQDFQWSAFQSKIVDKIEEVVSEAGSIAQEAPDTAASREGQERPEVSGSIKALQDTEHEHQGQGQDEHGESPSHSVVA